MRSTRCSPRGGKAVVSSPDHVVWGETSKAGVDYTSRFVPEFSCRRAPGRVWAHTQDYLRLLVRCRMDQAGFWRGLAGEQVWRRKWWPNPHRAGHLGSLYLSRQFKEQLSSLLHYNNMNHWVWHQWLLKISYYALSSCSGGWCEQFSSTHPI